MPQSSEFMLWILSMNHFCKHFWIIAELAQFGLTDHTEEFHFHNHHLITNDRSPSESSKRTMDSPLCLLQLFQNFEDFDVHFVESLGQFGRGLPQDWESIADQVLSQVSSHQPSVGVTFIWSRSFLRR